MMNMLELLILAIFWIFPAYVANGAPVILGGGKPLDFGKNINKKRIFGDGKTIRGCFAGIVSGSFIGFVLGEPRFGFLLALGAILGDLAGSFIKRRFGLKQGHPTWFLDQFDFILGAFLLGALVKVPSYEILAVILVVTPLLHLSTNFIAYKLRIKKVPW